MATKRKRVPQSRSNYLNSLAVKKALKNNRAVAKGKRTKVKKTTAKNRRKVGQRGGRGGGGRQNG